MIGEEKKEYGYAKSEINAGNFKKMLDLVIVFCFASLYLCFCVLNSNRDTYLSISYYVSFSLALLRIYFLIKYFDAAYYVLKIIIIAMLVNILIKNHNPFYNSLLFWLPFSDLFRALFMLKIFNILFELDFTSLKIDEQLELLNGKFSKYLDYKIFASFYDSKANSIEIKSKKIKFIFFIIFLIILKISIFFYDQNILPASYSVKVKQKKYFICANLFNNTNIIDDWTSEMYKLISYLGKENVFVSILENGDSKDDTAQKLENFKSFLNQEGIRNKIVTETIYTKKYFDRINFLTALRNGALDPMIYDIDWYFDEFLIIYFNDILYKWQDIVKLIMTNDMNYDMVCGLDYYFWFYDTWISRDLDGKKFRQYYPHFVDRTSQNRFINGEPIRVFPAGMEWQL